MRRISRTGSQSGFTLLEILLCLFIIGLMVGLVSVALPERKGQDLEQMAVSMKRAILIAQEESVFRSKDYGLLLSSDGYHFFSYQGEEWVPETSVSLLKAQKFPKDLRVQLNIEGESVDIDDASTPQILILSDGQLSEFSIKFARTDDKRSWMLSGSFDGALTVEAEGPS
ncbi:type II secretion system protein GspH [Motiliproteus sp. MSK22-1]|nr:type II secretion system protein GspH [Motiliproteus sp. MSK22-1]